MMDSKPYESAVVTSYEPLTDQPANHHFQKNSPLSAAPKSSNSYPLGLQSLTDDFNRVSSLDSKAFNKEVTFRILCPNDRVGCLIGKGGSVVKAFQNESGASIMVGPPVDSCEERVVTVTASEVCYKLFFLTSASLGLVSLLVLFILIFFLSTVTSFFAES